MMYRDSTKNQIKKGVSVISFCKLVTSMFNSIMHGLYMLVKKAYLCCPIVTSLTNIFYFIMDRLHMLLKAAFCSYFIFTIITLMFNSIIDRLHNAHVGEGGLFVLHYSHNTYKYILLHYG